MTRKKIRRIYTICLTKLDKCGTGYPKSNKLVKWKWHNYPCRFDFNVYMSIILVEEILSCHIWNFTNIQESLLSLSNLYEVMCNCTEPKDVTNFIFFLDLLGLGWHLIFCNKGYCLYVHVHTIKQSSSKSFKLQNQLKTTQK